MSTRWLPLLFLLACGCGPRDGDLLAQVGRRVGQKLEAASGGSPSQFAGRFRTSASPIGLADRVKTRLQWDRYLDGIAFAIDSPSEGVVKVAAKVPDEAKKNRVLDLARATTGVTDVIDAVELPKEK